MSLRDLAETDCGGSNPLVKFSTHFVQDHALKDQDLKQSAQIENNDQQFLDASTGEVKIDINCIQKWKTIFLTILFLVSRSVI